MIKMLLVRDLFGRCRRKRFYTKRLAFIGFGVIVMGLSYILGSNAGSSAVGLYLYRQMSLFAVAAAVLVATISSAYVFIHERQNGTLGMLFLTDITERGLLVAGIGSRLTLVSLAFCSLLPFFLVMVGLGGIIPLQILSAYAILLSAIFLCSALGLFVSASANTEMGMLGLSALMILITFAFLPLVFGAVGTMLGLNFELIFGASCSFIAMFLSADPEYMRFAFINAGVNLAMGMGFLLLAQLVLRIRRSDGVWLMPLEKGIRKRKTSTRVLPVGREHDSHNAMTRRELRGGLHRLRNVQWIVWMGLTVVGFVAFFVSFLLNSLNGRPLTQGMDTMLLVVGTLPALVVLLFVMYWCSQGFASEKRDRVLDLLILSDLKVSEIFTGKLVAIGRAFLPSLIASQAILMVSMFVAMPENAEVAVFIYFDALSMLVAFPYLALALSLRYRRGVALGVCLTIFVVWNVLGRVFFMQVFFNLFSWSAAFLLDFAFHIELVLLGSILMERWFKQVESGGTHWFSTQEGVA